MLIYRVLTAIVLIPLVIIALFWAPLSLFTVIIVAICGLAAWEWSQFLHLGDMRSRLIFVIISLVILASLSFIPFSIDPINTLFSSILILSLPWWLIALLLVINYPLSARYWQNSIIIKSLFALFTLLPFFIGMLELRAIDYGTNQYSGAIWLLYLFILVWTTDTGAYFAGKSFGKHKLIPKVSPGKTVEGFIGGVGSAIIIALIAYCTQLFSVRFDVFMLSSLLAILASVLGDLTESMFKREAGVKDSGNLIPGHGGILDRIDSLTAAVPVFAALSLYILK
ncbi:phosphatidate cytidylyltransferase [Orbaceae bacterium ESL0721]|nr:phosphatidate cytidylyltransferase [Orbaceae bacterium ESL0721]